MKNAMITVRVDQDVKEQAVEIFDASGLSLSSAIVLFLNETIVLGKMPFIPTPRIKPLPSYEGMFLFYNPIEAPEKVCLKSEKLGINKTYEDMELCDLEYASIPDLIKLANKSDDYEEVSVYLTGHNDAYFKQTKSPRIPDCVAYEAKGWISLKGVKNGGGFLSDYCPIFKTVRKDGTVEIDEENRDLLERFEKRRRRS